MAVDISPTKRQLENWVQQFVPTTDLFFIEEYMMQRLQDYLEHVLIMPRSEFSAHPSYKQIQLINSYTYWRISTTATRVIIAPPHWIGQLPSSIRTELLQAQYQMGRGLCLPLSFFPSPAIVRNYTIDVEGDHFVCLQSKIWNSLPPSHKEHVLKLYAQEWDTWTTEEIPAYTPIHIQTYANQFPMASGSNCLAATLFAVNGQDWILHEWLYPQAFVNGLTQTNHIQATEPLQPADVIVWQDENGAIQHASYHIGDQLFFNKNGQTFFNPWKIVHMEDLVNEWGHLSQTLYRKRGGHPL